MMETEEGRAALLEGRPPLNVVPKGCCIMYRCLHHTFHTEALEALARPYVQQAEVAGEDVDGDVFFDSQELEVLELPEDASPDLVHTLASDAAELYSVVQAEEEPLVVPPPAQPAPVEGRRRGSGRVCGLVAVSSVIYAWYTDKGQAQGNAATGAGRLEHAV